MRSPPPRRRQTLVTAPTGGLSEGVLVGEGEQMMVEVAGGPPFAVLSVTAADRWVGSVTLDRLGAGAATVTGVGDPGVEGSIRVTLRHGSSIVLEGRLSS